MRIYFTDLLLFGAAFAAPIQDVDQTAKSLDHSNFVIRGLVPLLERGLPLPPKASLPHASPEPAGLRPGQGSCRWKRGCFPSKARGGTGASKVDKGKSRATDPNIEQRYTRDLDDADFQDIPNGKYLEGTGLLRADPWTKSTIENRQQVRDLFFSPDAMQQRESAWTALNWNPSQKDAMRTHLRNKYENSGDPILETVENAPKGGIIVKKAYNKERDLHENHVETARVKRQGEITFNIQGINPSEKVFTSDMIWDNWVVACRKAGVEVDSLRYIGQDNIVTRDTRLALDVAMEGNSFKVFTPESGLEWDMVAGTIQAKTINRMIRQHEAELGPKRVESYTIVKRGENYDMLVTLTG